MTLPSRTTTAPTGTSPRLWARRASRSAAAMPSRSPGGMGGLVPRPPSPVPVSGTNCLSRASRRHPLEPERRPLLRTVHLDGVPFAVLALQHRHGERVLEQALDGALERPGPVHGVVALGRDQRLRRRRDLQGELAVPHELLHALDLELHNAADLLLPQRPED